MECGEWGGVEWSVGSGVRWGEVGWGGVGCSGVGWGAVEWGGVWEVGSGMEYGWFECNLAMSLCSKDTVLQHLSDLGMKEMTPKCVAKLLG